jgi:hypothetical protein
MKRINFTSANKLKRSCTSLLRAFHVCSALSLRAICAIVISVEKRAVRNAAKESGTSSKTCLNGCRKKITFRTLTENKARYVTSVIVS